MTLNASGPISIAGTTAGQSIQVELGGTGTTQMSLNCTTVRTLAGVPSGAIVMPTNFWGKSAAPPFGCATYTSAGSYSFVVPTGITKICVVCVGAGGGGTASGGGGTQGGGGALSYTNCISVTAGETLTVAVGAGGGKATVGADSSVKRGATTLILAKGGNSAGGQASGGTGAVKYTGGRACFGNGGGAAGYAGNGNDYTNPASGGAGGSGQPAGCGACGLGGGGVGLYALGATGACNLGLFGAGGGGSGGASGFGAYSQCGGAYGGGGGTEDCDDGYDTPSRFGAGARGGVRIIYGGTGKSYPSNAT